MGVVPFGRVVNPADLMMKPIPRRTIAEGSTLGAAPPAFGGVRRSSLVAITGIVLVLNLGVHADEFTAPLPAGMEAVWDLDQTHHENTHARELICFVYTHNYGCMPGSHLSFAEVLQAADDVGMLVSFSQPHFGHHERRSPDADRDNGYLRHAEFYVRKAQNHPSVVFYSLSHNATGYSEDMNPDMIDGVHDPRDTWALNNSELALRAEAIVRRLDPSRIAYHHSSGNLGSMHTSNFYPNFAPIQELSDWFEHWATRGVNPMFICEYGAPFTWDWAMYRGWYKGERNFGSAGFRGSSASPNGARSSSETGPSGSPRWRRRTCAGRPGNSAPATSGTAGITLTNSDRRSSTTGTR